MSYKIERPIFKYLLALIFTVILCGFTKDDVKAATLLKKGTFEYVSDIGQDEFDFVTSGAGHIVILYEIYSPYNEILTSNDGVKLTVTNYETINDSYTNRFQTGWTGMYAYYYSDVKVVNNDTVFVTFEGLSSKGLEVRYEVYVYPDLTTSLSLPYSIDLKTEQTQKIEITNQIPRDSFLAANINSSDNRIASTYYDLNTHSWYVQAIKAGQCMLTIQLVNGRQYSCKVNISNPAPRIKYTKINMNTGQSVSNPILYTKQKVKWSTSNKKIATVSSKGTIKAKKIGKCIITGTIGKKKYKCTVNVVRRPPNSDATLTSYNTRGNYFNVMIHNFGDKPLKIFSANAKSKDKDYKSYDRKLQLSKNRNVTIPAGKSKNIRFYIKGRPTWPDVDDHTIYYYFEYDGKKYYAYACDGAGAYKNNGEWYETELE